MIFADQSHLVPTYKDDPVSNVSTTARPSMMAIEITEPGGPHVLVPTMRSVPLPATHEVLIRIHASGVNGPDVLQRKGLYDPPAGASDIPGLEIAGEVVAVGSGVTRFSAGDLVCALISGGGYAEYAVANESVTLKIPNGLSVVEAAAMPETFMTVWLNLFQRGKLKKGETVLIHGGASGIGTTATMLAKAFGAAKIITTVASEAHRDASLGLGADLAINYLEEDFVEETKRFTDGNGVDVILDIIGGDYVARNYQAAAMNGRIVQVSVINGPSKELDLWPMLTKRLTHIGSTLRSRTYEDKASIIRELERNVWPFIEAGTVKPVIYKEFPLEDARGAHELMDAATHIGKIALTTGAKLSA
jgi:NADPH:quinone reductase